MFVVIRKREASAVPGVLGLFHTREAAEGWVSKAFKGNEPERCTVVPLEFVKATER